MRRKVAHLHGISSDLLLFAQPVEREVSPIGFSTPRRHQWRPLCAPPARPLTADVVLGVASSSFSFPLKIGPVRRNYSKLAQRNKRI